LIADRDVDFLEVKEPCTSRRSATEPMLLHTAEEEHAKRALNPGVT
jgi:hypothetical protein